MEFCKIPSNYAKDCSKKSDIIERIKASVLQDKETNFNCNILYIYVLNYMI